MPVTFESAARIAKEWARSQVRLKSSNKSKLADPKKRARSQEAGLWLGKFRGEMAPFGTDYASAEDVCAKADKFLRFGVTPPQWTAWRRGWYTPLRAGNCQELCELAFYYIYKVLGIQVVDLVTLENDGDHVFVVIGQSSWPTLQHSRKRRYHLNFNNWDDVAWICDPWANIHCPARVYPTFWRSKMTRWFEKDKWIQLDKTWFAPNRPSIMEMIVRNPKVSLCPRDLKSPELALAHAARGGRTLDLSET
ncbi:MAG TPA: hypothetical protein VM580_02975 [Labilithrix sp.]|nr:hypothetical protein [Labilithrix sp.]